jgi:hypothetical protein
MDVDQASISRKFRGEQFLAPLIDLASPKPLSQVRKVDLVRIGMKTDLLNSKYPLIINLNKADGRMKVS